MNIEKDLKNKLMKRVKIMEIDKTPDVGSSMTPNELFIIFLILY